MVGGGDPGSNSVGDEALIGACLAGESAAWYALIDRYGALIYSIALRYGFTEGDAADIFQSVCLTLFGHLEAIRAPRGLAAWLITTTSRQCIAVLRQRAREQRGAASRRASGNATEPVDPELLPEDTLLALERQFVVRRAVASLPATCRTLIEALFSDTASTVSYAELAEALAISPNSLGPTRARCLARLRKLLDAAGFVP